MEAAVSTIKNALSGQRFLSALREEHRVAAIRSTQSAEPIDSASVPVELITVRDLASSRATH